MFEPTQPGRRKVLHAAIGKDRQEMKPLNPRQESFINHLVGGMSPPNAAKAAGYSPGIARHATERLLSIPSVKAALEERKAVERTQADITIERKINLCA